MSCSPKLYWFTFAVQTYAPIQTMHRKVNEGHEADQAKIMGDNLSRLMAV
jgi:hypothetical protein